jgi:UDP-N-acetylmuramate dehydrogenase
VNRLEQLHADLIARGYGERVLVNEPLAQHTSFAIGGPADLLIIVRQLDELRTILRLAWAAQVPTLLLGCGTNILVADAGVRGLVIVNKCCGFALDADGLLVTQSGMSLRKLAAWTVEQHWAGLEWAVGIPGTVGGAVVGNAGAYGGCMADSVQWVTCLWPDGREEKCDKQGLAYGYRTSALKRESRPDRRPVVLEAALQLHPGKAEELAQTVESITAQRKARTPDGCCAGSVFKRTAQYPAGFLIEQVGLKGRRLGGAQVSEKHANFVMNTGGATAVEVKALIELLQREVWSAFAQRLEPEIEFVGEW